MKKILALVLCAILMVFVFTVSIFADGEEIVTEAIPTVEEPVVDTAVTVTSAEQIIAYIKAHFEEISVVITLILTAFYNVRKHKLLNKSISATNHNAITVSENSDRVISEALVMIDGYREEFKKLLEEYRVSEEEKRKLQKIVKEAMAYIKTAKLANVEFADELAELLVLANIPNSKKDELYARHIAAVNSISEAEESVTLTEVNEDDIGQAE